MGTPLDRIAEIQKAAIPGRLTIGAGHLGRFWKEGTRCQSGWRAACACGAVQTPFCRAKLRWIDLVRELHGGNPYGLVGNEEFFVIEAMTLSMVKASGLTVIVDVPAGRKPIKVGGELETWNIFPTLGEMDPDNVAGFLESVALIQEKL